MNSVKKLIIFTFILFLSFLNIININLKINAYELSTKMGTIDIIEEEIYKLFGNKQIILNER